MTFSIVARDPATGDLAVAVQSRFLAVGSCVPWARAGVGAVATQSFANVAYGPDGLALLAAGANGRAGPREARAGGRPPGTAPGRHRRCPRRRGQPHRPRAASHGRVGARATVSPPRATSWPEPASWTPSSTRTSHGGRPFPELLVACLAAADAAGGDRRGREVREPARRARGRRLRRRQRPLDRPAGGRPPGPDRRARPDPRPDATCTWTGRTPAELLPLDETLAAQIRGLLARAGWDPGRGGGPIYAPMWPDEAGPEEERPSTGEPRPLPDGWDDAWQESPRRLDGASRTSRSASRRRAGSTRGSWPICG